MPGSVLSAAGVTKMLSKTRSLSSGSSWSNRGINGSKKRLLGTVRDIFLKKVPLRWPWKGWLSFEPEKGGRAAHGDLTA